MTYSAKIGGYIADVPEISEQKAEFPSRVIVM